MERINWQTILNLNEDQVSDLRLVAYHYIRQGKYDIARAFLEALAIFQSQRSLDEQDPYDFQALGGLYLQLGDHERALRYLDRALRLSSDHIPTQLNRAKVLFILRRFDEAMVAADELRTCPEPSVSDAAEALQISHRELYEAMLLEREQAAKR